MGRKYWRGLVGWLRRTMLAEGCISPEDTDLFVVTDDVDTAVRKIIDYRENHPVAKSD